MQIAATGVDLQEEDFSVAADSSGNQYRSGKLTTKSIFLKAAALQVGQQPCSTKRQCRLQGLGDSTVIYEIHRSALTLESGSMPLRKNAGKEDKITLNVMSERTRESCANRFPTLAKIKPDLSIHRKNTRETPKAISFMPVTHLPTLITK